MWPVLGEVDDYVDQLKRKGTFEEYGLGGKDISDGGVIESIAGDWALVSKAELEQFINNGASGRIIR